MSEDLLSALAGNARLNHESCGLVPEIMKAELCRETSPPQRAARDVSQQNIRVDGRAVPVLVRRPREDEAAVGDWTRELPALELGDEAGRKRHQAGARLGLGRTASPPRLTA
jgi:hypothetical protein